MDIGFLDTGGTCHPTTYILRTQTAPFWLKELFFIACQGAPGSKRLPLFEYAFFNAPGLSFMKNDTKYIS